ncbi:alpha-L-fucosidase [Acidicapsa dinghuensis]|uniref:alpha-L-fucosidase n=1 Tax=Acidicapsa dinghuensis TaxID=2218256 RepID=A0ABW1EKV1_9BACT|nr:alpha-L-fucosidase [Acidicapsa dinghuensis]
MQTRRDICKWMAGAASLALSATNGLAITEESQGPVVRRGKPLLELQQNFIDLRFGMFIHFNMATFQDREWGDPTSPATLFHPTALDTDQWAEAAKSANMTWGCLTTRHHDGFCLWPTKTRSASVAQSGQNLDVVRRYVDSFRKAGLRTALYYSILSLRDDIRHFNMTPDKIKLVKDQLTELFSNYGEIDALIIDGWNAPWSRITYEEMPFPEIYEHIKSIQPNCLVSDLNASQFPAGGLYYTDLKAFEQNAGQKVPQGSDLPAFSCVTITPGWFWKQSDINGPLKPTETVVNEWLVPLNRRHCNMILNAPPDRTGQMAPNVVARLKEIGQAWKHSGPMEKVAEHVVITRPNLATAKPIHASSYPDTVGPDLVNDGNYRSSWNVGEGNRSGWLEVDLRQRISFNVLSLVEPVGAWNDYQESRIANYKFEAWNGSGWSTIVESRDPGPVRIHRIARNGASKVRLSIEGNRDDFHVADIGIYDEPA